MFEVNPSDKTTVKNVNLSNQKLDPPRTRRNLFDSNAQDQIQKVAQPYALPPPPTPVVDATTIVIKFIALCFYLSISFEDSWVMSKSCLIFIKSTYILVIATTLEYSKFKRRTQSLLATRPPCHWGSDCILIIMPKARTPQCRRYLCTRWWHGRQSFCWSLWYFCGIEKWN